ncbi:MAG TPA: Rrf2 family transcriptional regulator [Acidobacteriaceae bacterium]|nr:Rrf2 family transcriptional regulator [Acidobacteriaceae bacterium]
MAENLRFANGIEALALMATEPEKYRTSQALASAMATNPVVVRRLLSALSHAGLVTSVKGPTGGSRLAKSAKQITMRDVYRAVSAGDLLHRGTHDSEDMHDLRKAVHGVFKKAQKRFEEELDSTTLHQLIKKSGKKLAKASPETLREKASPDRAGGASASD